MDAQELSKHYMEKYNALVKEYEGSGIRNVVLSLNEAISQQDMQKANLLYNEVMTWNFKVANLEGERDSLNSQYRYLHLPSIIMFSIILDEEEKKWRFEAGTNL